MKIIKAFSLIELLMCIIVLSIVLAISTPVITKRLTKQSFRMTLVNKLSKNCQGIDTDCKMCVAKHCVSCEKKCPKEEYLDEAACKCKKCSDIFQDCDVCVSNKCVKCSDGHGNNDTSECKKCPGGEFSNGISACAPCPAGTFSSESANSCEPCPKGEYQPHQGQKKCIICNGVVSDDRTSCTPCSGFGSACLRCSDGVCTACKDGYHLEAETVFDENDNFSHYNYTCKQTVVTN